MKLSSLKIMKFPIDISFSYSKMFSKSLSLNTNCNLYVTQNKKEIISRNQLLQAVHHTICPDSAVLFV